MIGAFTAISRTVIFLYCDIYLLCSFMLFITIMLSSQLRLKSVIHGVYHVFLCLVNAAMFLVATQF